jgi:glycerol-3-phosphate dehydrogenase (NAD(P)+)
MKNKKIVIMGNGKIGKAIFHLLNKNKAKFNHSIDIYDKDESKNTGNKTLKEYLTDADFIFLCIPSWCTKEALIDIKPHIETKTILISVAKGIDSSSQQTIDKLIESQLKNQYALLSGPMFAVEIMENERSFAVLASRKKKTFDEVSNLFVGTKLRLEYSKDVHSVAISAVLKNIYTLIVSMVNVSEKGKNTRGFLCSKSIEEIIKMMKILRLNSKISLGVSGLGDFVATASSEYSQNRKVGEEIFTKGKSSIKSEGLISFPSMIKILGKKSKKLPLLSLAERILIKNKDPKTEIEEFFE